MVTLKLTTDVFIKRYKESKHDLDASKKTHYPLEEVRRRAERLRRAGKDLSRDDPKDEERWLDYETVTRMWNRGDETPENLADLLGLKVQGLQAKLTRAKNEGFAVSARAFDKVTPQTLTKKARGYQDPPPRPQTFHLLTDEQLAQRFRDVADPTGVADDTGVPHYLAIEKEKELRAKGFDLTKSEKGRQGVRDKFAFVVRKWHEYFSLSELRDRLPLFSQGRTLEREEIHEWLIQASEAGAEVRWNDEAHGSRDKPLVPVEELKRRYEKRRLDDDQKRQFLDRMMARRVIRDKVRDEHERQVRQRVPRQWTAEDIAWKTEYEIREYSIRTGHNIQEGPVQQDTDEVYGEGEKRGPHFYAKARDQACLPDEEGEEFLMQEIQQRWPDDEVEQIIQRTLLRRGRWFKDPFHPSAPTPQRTGLDATCPDLP